MIQKWDKWILIDIYTNRANTAQRNLENEDYKTRSRSDLKNLFRLEANLFSAIISQLDSFR